MTTDLPALLRPIRRGFALTDLCVVLVVVAGMLAIQATTLGAARGKAREMQSMTQLRGIHQGLVTFAQSNKQWYAGLGSDGKILSVKAVGNGKDLGDTVQGRYRIMLDGDFFSPDYAVSPDETADVEAWDPQDEANVLWDKKTKNYSYTMSDIHRDAQFPQLVSKESRYRRAEWTASLNSQAIVLSDRNAGKDADKQVRSIYTKRPGDWKGLVLWNDNHVQMDKRHDAFVTQYGNGELNADLENNGLDNLFTDTKDEGPTRNANALMIITGNRTVQTGE